MAAKGERVRKRSGAAPIPLEPVDLLAGLAPGVDLEADAPPPEVGGGPDPEVALASVAEVGKLVRAGEEIIRRLIRSPAIGPSERDADDGSRLEPERAGVVPRTRERPGE